MGVSYECAASILLCGEDNSSIMGFEDDDEVGVNGEDKQSCGFYGDSLMAFPLQSEECLGLMVQRETDHLPGRDYAMRLMTGDLDISVRRDAIDWIGKVHAYYNFGPLTAYLSINYLDRFLAAYDLSKGKAWMTQLVSVACLSLAAKMEEAEVPLSLDLQVGEARYVFEARTIQRMELLVLSTLKWRMQAVTPFSFIDYFLHKHDNGNSPSKSSISRAIELILNTIRGIGVLEFKPSEVAAAVAMLVLGETQLVDVDKAITCCIHVEKERVMRCYEVIQETALMNKSTLRDATPSTSSVPQSPIGVLDAACLSYKSDNAVTVGSQPSSHHSSPDTKRRRLSRPQ